LFYIVLFYASFVIDLSRFVNWNDSVRALVEIPRIKFEAIAIPTLVPLYVGLIVNERSGVNHIVLDSFSTSPIFAPRNIVLKYLSSSSVSNNSFIFSMVLVDLLS